MKAIVMTHHAPLMSVGNPIHTDSVLHSAFASDLSSLILSYSDTIKYWMYGHDHYSMMVNVGAATIISNQVGYKGEHCTLYKKDLILEA